MSATTDRNHGIDFLRILSMLLVVILHVLGKGGILNQEPSSLNDNIAWLLEAMTFCSVNCYALITGYVCYGREQRYSRFFALCMQVLFYSTLITALFALLAPETVGFVEIKNSLLVVKQYWYFTAYAILFVFMPFLNRLIDALPGRALTALVLLILLVESIIPTVTQYQGFFNQDGYGSIWLGALYIIGAWIRISSLDAKISKAAALSGYFVCSLLAWAGRIFWWEDMTPLFSASSFISYSSPLILMSGVFLFLFCLKLNLKGQAVSLIAFFAPLSFSVYLIHTHPLVFRWIMQNRFASFVQDPWYIMAGSIAGVCLGIYVACSLIDRLREQLFKLLHINQLSQKMECLIVDRLGNRILNFTTRASGSTKTD